MAMTPQKRARMEKLIYDFFTAFDKTKTNTNYYKSLFSSMADKQFEEYFKGFFADDKAYLQLNIADYENSINLDDIERAAKVINIPLFEDVWSPYATYDKKNVVKTQEKVPVGYLIVKRTQQTVGKKKGISVNIDKRSAITGQVTGDDKNGKQSDLENTMLTSMGLKNTLKELNGPRADDLYMKQQMLKSIATNGYSALEDMESLPENKTTLNTINVYLLGMGINSDLVTKGLLTKKGIKDKL